MGELVKVERDNKALAAALAEVLKAHGLQPNTQLGSLPIRLQSAVMQRAHALRKEYE